MKWKKSFQEKGFVTGICLIVLLIVSVLMLSIGSVGMMNLDTQQSYRVSSLAQYAAQAVVQDAMAQISMNNSYGSSTTTLTVPLNNNLTGTVNFASVPCSPCPQFYSINNLAGTATLNDGFNHPVPPGYVKLNGRATHLGKTVTYSVLAIPLPYSILSQSTITAEDVSGIVRNNVTSGAGAINVTSATMAITPDTSPGAITGSVNNPVTGASQINIPDVDISSIAANCGPPSGPSCAAQGCINVTGMSGVNMAGPNCYYSTGNWTMKGNSGGGFTMTNGARLYVFGDLTIEGGPHLDISGGPANNLIVVSGTVATTNGNVAKHSWNASFFVKGQAGQNGIQVNGPGVPDITGFIYAENGNINLNANLSGSMIVKGGSVGIDDVTYNSTYIQSYKDLFTTGIPLNVMSAWNQ